ncbi:uncharacterized protein LOC127800087 [Diospyros lotus]|uniref:uncharacterized protein LOC127800087 n=1 Tax=Diospyros lotus TaxID=55363 RepID=UPI002258E2A2|nr:uncharacterized protein LOC127800087 [Diospyros lotus]
MASNIGACPRATPRAAVMCRQSSKFSGISIVELSTYSGPRVKGRPGGRQQSWRIRASNGGDSYLSMWKKVVEQERKVAEFQRLADKSAGVDGNVDGWEGESPEVLERKSKEFEKILEVPTEERDRVQRMQVIDRAAAAIAAARAVMKESLSPPNEVSDGASLGAEFGGHIHSQQREAQNESLISSQSTGVENGTPGPDFWSWTPPAESDSKFDDESHRTLARQTYQYPINVNPVIEKEQSVDFLAIPLESKLSESKHYPPLPPLQSLMEVEKLDASTFGQELENAEGKRIADIQFSAHAAEAADALKTGSETSTQGVNPDGSRWWKETKVEQRPDGVVCRWTLTRGVTGDKALEWEEKYWEAADQFGYKELGSEKSGRDAVGNVWREFWKESMWQDHGLVHMEKTADKWGRNGKGDEWQEKWWERYDASGQAEKWAHKWCSIDPSTQLEAGHAHVWHERWGEKYDGKGSSVKYTDKWAERSEGDGWTKWGDKWDEHFDSNGDGVKQGETWWQGKFGERWNRTWGEGHNGSGWVHKYGKSSCGEHWDTHVQQETWYERYPHFGFQHCFDNSVQLREVRKPSDWS